MNGKAFVPAYGGRNRDSGHGVPMNIENGYVSSNYGRQELTGPAMEALDLAIDTNSAPRIDNDRWLATLARHRARMDRLHVRIFGS